MKRTIAVKRAELFREWVLATLANNEEYYFSTLYLGIPDGEDEDMVMDDLMSGFYDDDIDDTLEVYSRAKSRYGKDGYYVNNKLYDNETDALTAYGRTIPKRIYKFDYVG